MTGNWGSIPEKEHEKRLLLLRKAAGAQIIQWKQISEIVTKNNNVLHNVWYNWNEYNLKPLTRNNWRASLVPAAAVIPAPIAYINVVAVKKLVVETWVFLSSLVYLLRFWLLDDTLPTSNSIMFLIECNSYLSG